MMPTRQAQDVLNREFLEMRAKVLELAASMDRLDRAVGSVTDDPRIKKLREALALVTDERGDRAEQVQLIFSRHYHKEWRREFELARSTS